jgi:hypothetical protein
MKNQDIISINVENIVIGNLKMGDILIGQKPQKNEDDSDDSTSEKTTGQDRAPFGDSIVDSMAKSRRNVSIGTILRDKNKIGIDTFGDTIVGPNLPNATIAKKVLGRLIKIWKSLLLFFHASDKINMPLILIFLSAYFISGCRKNWLDAKPSQSLVVPSTVADYQALLDNTRQYFNINAPNMGLIASDDYYLTDASYQMLGLFEQNVYIWNPNPYNNLSCIDWNFAYSRVLYENTVLTGLGNVAPTTATQTAWDNVKGTALVFRAFDFYNLSQIFCKLYDSTSANTDLGLPLRLTPDISSPATRASLQATYDQVIGDLKASISLLPNKPAYPTRPSVPAVYGLLARIYLAMRKYPQAELYADSCLATTTATLLDYNNISKTSTTPFIKFNSEVIFHSQLASYASTSPGYDNVDSLLVASYQLGDLRGPIFCKNRGGTTSFYGSYSGNRGNNFCGVALDEIYLTDAECKARRGDTTTAMSQLNALLAKRFATGAFTPLYAFSQANALALILQERRKELLFRGLRWPDLRRLNTETQLATTISRLVNGQPFTLPPGDPRYVFQIPPDELRESGIQPNNY